jgi:hypothetical protein
MVGLMLAGADLQRRRSGSVRLRPSPLAVSVQLQPTGRGLVPALVAGLLLALALGMAPEAPQDQAAICQRHNGVAACRVW